MKLPPSSSDGATAKKKKKKPKDGSPSTPTKKKKKKTSSVTADGDPSAKKPKSPKSPKAEEGSSPPTKKKKKKKKTPETTTTSPSKKERKPSPKSRITDTGRDIEEGKVVVAEVVDHTESTIPLAEAVGERQADLCCDSCCDVRKATIICDIIYIVVLLTLLIVYAAGLSEVNGSSSFDDDFEGLGRSFVNGLLIGLVVKNSVGILLGSLSIFGALKYKKWFVLITGIWICIDFVANFFFIPWFAGIVLAAFSYPHFALFRALHQGKITAENYHVTEEYCCCSQKKN